jgi:hypothetical protein
VTTSDPRVAAKRGPKLGRLAGVAGLASTVLWFASMLLGHAVAAPGAAGPVTDADALLTLHQQGNRQLLSSVAGALYLLLIVPVALYLAVAIRRRRTATGAWVTALVVCVPLLLAVLSLAAHFQVQTIASAFVSGGAHTAQRAHQLLAASAALTVMRVLEYAAGLAFAGWIGFVSLTGIEVGLLTRQLGYFGLGTAVARITVPMAGDALFIGFLLAISCLALGYWPGGRPPAWDADAAVASWRNAATSSAR